MPTKKRRGRPPKSEIVSRKRGTVGTRGRPKGDAAIINEYKARMLASPKSRRVLETIFDAALDNDHKNQAAAWKLVMDRTLPLSYFEKDAASGRSSVNITISGLGSNVETNVDSNDIEDGEIIEQDV